VTTSSHAIPIDAGATVAGIRLRIGAGYRVFRLALGTVARASRTLRDIVGLRRTNALRSAVQASLRSTQSPSSTPDGLGAALAAARSLIGSADADPVDPRLKRAVALIDGTATSSRGRSGRAAIEETARAVAMSPRTLERLFHDHIGLTPRTFMRLRRVCAVAARLEAPVTFLGCSTSGGHPTLSHLAHHAGFADHAHLTRDFRRAMGVTPSEYAREARERPIIREWRGVRPELLTPLGTIAEAVTSAAEQAA
jgi:AraC-like DNA-binding protein